MSVKRYIIHYDARGEEEHPKGDFVHWPDYQALASQFAEKQEQLDELPSPALWDESRKALASMRNEVGELKRQLAEQIEVRDNAIDDLQRKWWAAEAERDRLAAAAVAMLEAIDSELDTDERSASFLGRVSRLRNALTAGKE